MRLWWWIVGAFVALYVVAFILIAGAHLAYPYEVDNLEGNLWAMAAQVAAGHRLYTAPSVDYTPFCYAPLYFYAGAAMMKLLGAGYAALRAVSVLSTFATATTIYVTLRCERIQRRFAVIAVAIFLGAYGRTHEAGDIARVDAFALALALPAVALAIAGTPRLRNACLAGVCGGLAILAKQPMLVLVAAAIVTQLFRGRRVYAVVIAVTTIATAAGVLAALDLFADRWTYFYCVEVPASHHLRPWDLVVLAPVFLVTTLPIALVAPLVRFRTFRAALADPWTAVTVAYAAMAILARAKEGGSANVFLPVVALAAVQLARHAEPAFACRPGWTLAAITAQLALLVWSPLARWPTRADVAAGDQLVARIAAIPGDVYVPGFPAYAMLAGKPWHAHYVALCDVARLDPVRDELARQIAAHRFAAVLPVMDVAPIDIDRCDVPGLAVHYRRAGAIAPLAPPPLFDAAHRNKVGDVWR
jgi:hypothetical protein